MTQTIKIKTHKRSEMVDISSQVQKIVSQHAAPGDICMVYVPHTTAGITINEGADPDVCCDIIAKLDETVPASSSYRHREGNSDSHIKASLMGSSVNVIIEDRRLLLGTWQKIFFCEFDGPRQREVYVKVI